jgi:hypothetical protein
MLSYKSLFRFMPAVLALAFCAPTLAQTPQAEINAYAIKAPISGLPKGPYSHWTAGQRQSVFGHVRGFCQFLCMDKYANMTFPDRTAADRTVTESKICLGACIAEHLPSDYPGLAELTRQLRTDYNHAKQLGSTTPWPLSRLVQ